MEAAGCEAAHVAKLLRVSATFGVRGSGTSLGETEREVRGWKDDKLKKAHLIFASDVFPVINKLNFQNV